MANKVVSITVDVEKATQMMDFYRSYQRVNNGEYIIFQAYYSGITITIYQDKKFKHNFITPFYNISSLFVITLFPNKYVDITPHITSKTPDI